MRRLIVNARVATGNPARPWADALLFEGDRLVRVGSSAALRKEARDAEIVDARGAAYGADGTPLDGAAPPAPAPPID